MPYPFSALAVFVLMPGDASADAVALGLDYVVIAVFVEIGYPGLGHQGPLCIGLAEVDVLVRCPFYSFAVGVLEPYIGPDYVIIAVSVDIADPCGVYRAVNGRPDPVLFPFLRRVGRYLIPE